MIIVLLLLQLCLLTGSRLSRHEKKVLVEAPSSSDPSDDGSVIELPDIGLDLFSNDLFSKITVTTTWNPSKIPNLKENVTLEVVLDDSSPAIITVDSVDFRSGSVEFGAKRWVDHANRPVSLIMKCGKDIISALDGVVLLDYCKKLALEEMNQDSESYSEGDKDLLCYRRRPITY